MSTANQSAPGGAEGSQPGLERQAASAALYHTPPSGSEPEHKDARDSLLDQDQRLSSAAAASSLKYANPRDLPSYPVVGVKDTLSTAGAAASLANAHKKPFQHWTPDKSASASAAAVLAKDYKMAELWRPEQHSEGSKAAYLAATQSGNVKVWKPGSTEYGHSAAAQAVRAADTLSPKLDDGHTLDGRKRSLRASKLAMAGSRKRADSTPVASKQDDFAAGASHKAFDAASVAHDSPMDHLLDDMPPSVRASRITNIKGNVPREMFGSHPPVGPEVDEEKRAAALHSAAVSMARQMYNLQQKTISGAAGADRSSISSGPSAMPVTNLEEAARRLAAERLAKLQDEHAAYREYYGTGTPSAPGHRMSLKGRGRRRASSMGQSVDEEDEARSRRIRAEMSIFNKNVAEVDEKKRQKDREALMAAAQRNVRASLHNLDERVFAETGKASPSMMEEWEAKARAKAESDSKARMANYGRVDIGGGKYVDRSDVEAVASRNVQPVLDEINDKAQLHHTKQEEARRERELAKQVAEDEKARQKELKAEFKKIYVQDKEEARRRKREEKAKKAEEKRRRKEEKRRAKEEAKAKAKAKTIAATGAEPEAHPVAEPARDTTSSSSSSSLEDSSDDEAPAPEVPQPAVGSTEGPTSAPVAAETTEGSTTVPVVVETTETVAIVTTETIRTRPITVEPAEEVASPGPALDRAQEPEPAARERQEGKPTTAPSTSSKGESRVKSWLKDRFSRHGHAGKDHKAEEPHAAQDDHAPKATTAASTTDTTTSVPAATSASITDPPDVPIAVDPDVEPLASPTTGANEQPIPNPGIVPVDVDDEARQSRPRRRSSSPAVSPLTDDEAKRLEPEKPQPIDTMAATQGKIDANDVVGGLAPPPTTFAANISPRTSGSPVRDSKFQENL